MFSLFNSVIVRIPDIPLQWIPKIELYYPDLPQFPIMYIHFFCNQQRVLGVPVSVSYEINGNTCTAEFLVLTNTEPSDQLLSELENQIKERIGLSQAIKKTDVLSYCKNNEKYQKFFSELWTFIEASYGSVIPYGRFYEEIYSIVRFVAAWQPKTGRQSEMRMLYNFMSAFGEQAELPKEWSHLECYFIPTLFDIRNDTIGSFTKFQRMFSAIKKTFHNQYTVAVTISGHEFKVLPNAWPSNKDKFINDVSRSLNQKGVITDGERADLETLVDAFNRHSWRAAFFISAIITSKQDDYNAWDKDFFIEFYNNGTKLKGYSEKVIACFLQQGFLKDEFIPVDTWIKTFYQYPVGINKSDKEDIKKLYKTFDHLGKLERVIWLASQANKTNMKNFYDILWCQRFGTIGNLTLRGINPIACAECSLKSVCVGLDMNKHEKIIIINESDELSSPSADTKYICVMENNIPKKVYENREGSWVLIDEFSGYIMNDPLRPELINRGTVTMSEFIDNYKSAVFSK